LHLAAPLLIHITYPYKNELSTRKFAISTFKLRFRAPCNGVQQSRNRLL